MVEDLVDPRRTEPPFIAAERDMLENWLEFHRTTLILKTEGLTESDRKRRPIETSYLSLHGLVRHMAEVERNWFQRVLAENPKASPIWYGPQAPDADLFPLDDASWQDDFAIWKQECDQSRAIASTKRLDDAGVQRGDRCSLRWIYVHMIEEYARHNGHADLIREMLDGSVGW